MTRKLSYVAIGALATLTLLFAFMAHADISNPHPVPPASTVTETMIVPGTLTDQSVNGNAQISATKVSPRGVTGTVLLTDGTNIATTTTLSYGTSTKDLEIIGGRISATSTSFNSVNCTWPSTGGTVNYVLTTDGNCALSWSNPSPTTLTQSFTAGEAITAGNAVAMAGDSIVFDTSSGIYTGASPVSQSLNASASSSRMAVLYASFTTPGTVTATLNGSAMTQQAAVTGNSETLYMFTLTGIPSGSNTAILTYSGSGLNATDFLIYNGVASTTGCTATTTAQTAGNTTLTTTQTTSADGDQFIGFTYNRSGANNLSCGGNCKLRDGSGTSRFSFDSNYLYYTQGVYTVTANAAGSEDMKMIMCDLAPAGKLVKASGSDNRRYKGIMGIAQASAAYNASVNVSVGGIATGLSGLIGGAQYWVSNATGSVATTSGTNTAKIGQAVSDTVLRIVNMF